MGSFANILTTVSDPCIVTPPPAGPIGPSSPEIPIGPLNCPMLYQPDPSDTKASPATTAVE